MLLALAASLGHTALGIGARLGDRRDDRQPVGPAGRDGRRDDAVRAALLAAARPAAGMDRPHRRARPVGAGQRLLEHRPLPRPRPAVPLLADAGWLAFYPAAYVAHGAARCAPASAGCPRACGSTGSSACSPSPRSAWRSSSRRSSTAPTGSTAELVTNAANPVGDLVLASVVIAFLALSPRRSGRAWPLLAVGLCVFTAADVTYLYRLASDSYQRGRRARLDVAGRRGADGDGRMAASHAAHERPAWAAGAR